MHPFTLLWLCLARLRLSLWGLMFCYDIMNCAPKERVPKVFLISILILNVFIVVTRKKVCYCRLTWLFGLVFFNVMTFQATFEWQCHLPFLSCFINNLIIGHFRHFHFAVFGVYVASTTNTRGMLPTYFYAWNVFNMATSRISVTVLFSKCHIWPHSWSLGFLECKSHHFENDCWHRKIPVGILFVLRVKDAWASVGQFLALLDLGVEKE